MEDLLQSQIQDSCRLALPNGLKELMHDISREVLRAQPPDLLNFITKYLSTLLVTRENLYIASKVCGVVYDCQCQPELEDELRYIGLDERNASDAAEIIAKFFGTGEVNEGTLLLKLVKKTSIDESQLPAVLTAIRQAFLRHQRNHTKIYESSSNSDDDDTERAARHTLALYRKTEPTIETYNCMAIKIQASYRAYKVRRESGTIRSIKVDQLSKTPSKSESVISTDQVKSHDHLVLSSRTENERSKVTFGALDKKGNVANGQPDFSNDEDLYKYPGASKSRTNDNQVSSMSLAGSYLNLPRYRPYSAHEIDFGMLAGFENTPEKERSNFDYTRENSPVGEMFVNDLKETEPRNKKLAFYESPDDEDSIEEQMVELYEEEEEVILEDIVEDVEGIDNGHLAEDVMTEILDYVEDGLDVKGDVDIHKLIANSTEDKVDEQLEEEHVVSEENDSVMVHTHNTKENISDAGIEEDILEPEELPEVDLAEDMPEIGIVEVNTVEDKLAEEILRDIPKVDTIEVLKDDKTLGNDEMVDGNFE